MRLAQALSVAGRSEDAVEQYQAVLKLNKEWVPALSGIGFELMKQKDWKGGEEYFKRVIALTEGKTPQMSGGSSGEIANYYVGIARMEQRDYSGAAGYLKQALRMRRDASDTSYALSVCYRKLDIIDGQKEMLEYTLQFDPNMPEANYDYGLLLLAEGKTAEAAEHFRNSCRPRALQAGAQGPAGETRNGERRALQPPTSSPRRTPARRWSRLASRRHSIRSRSSRSCWSARSTRR